MKPVVCDKFEMVLENNDCVIVDVDGTLANNSHRSHWVKSKPRNWKAFNATIEDDEPYKDIVYLVRMFYAVGFKILIVSARTGDLRPQTIRWLDNVADLKGIYERLYMREEKDYRDDPIVKSELLDQIYADGYNPKYVLDDRNRVVQMFRERGLRVLHVQDGNF